MWALGEGKVPSLASQLAGGCDCLHSVCKTSSCAVMAAARRARAVGGADVKSVQPSWASGRTLRVVAWSDGEALFAGFHEHDIACSRVRLVGASR
jgi:hypothetical protein